jgi:hypothetical protein
VVGLMNNIFFFYPIALFVIGIVTICKGLMGGER